MSRAVWMLAIGVGCSLPDDPCIADGTCPYLTGGGDAACEDAAALGPLTRFGGCGDVTLFVTNEDDTLALLIEVDGLLSEASQSGEAESETWSEPGDDDVAVALITGEDLAAETCYGEGPRIDETFDPIDGEALVEVVPEDGHGWANVDIDALRLEHAGTGCTVSLGSFSVDDVWVGWDR